MAVFFFEVYCSVLETKYKATVGGAICCAVFAHKPCCISQLFCFKLDKSLKVLEQIKEWRLLHPNICINHREHALFSKKYMISLEAVVFIFNIDCLFLVKHLTTFLY